MLSWRPKNDVEAEILGPEHHDETDMNDVVAVVCDGSSLGPGQEAAEMLVHRFNCHADLLSACNALVARFGNMDIPEIDEARLAIAKCATKGVF